MDKVKWDKKKSEKAMKEGKEEFFEISKRLYTAVADFGVRALKTFQAGNEEPLNPLQINQIVAHEIGCVIEDLQRPRTADLIIRIAEQRFSELTESSDKAT